MLINPSNLDAMFYGLDARFRGAFQAAQPWYTQLATEVPSNTKSTRYHWLDAVPRMREWVGERFVRNMIQRSYVIENKSWELTLELDKEDVEDDQFNTANARAELMGRQAKKWPDDVLTLLIQAGTTTVCADGQYFFDTDHPSNYDDSSFGTYSNALSLALTATNYGAARAAMRGWVGADGRVFGVEPDTIIVPPQLEDTARTILSAQILAPAAGYGGNANGVAVSNIYANSAKLLVVPEFGNDPTRWYLACTSLPVKPFIFQMRKTPEFVSLTAPTDSGVFWQRKYTYGVDSRGNAGYTMPFLALTSKP